MQKKDIFLLVLVFIYSFLFYQQDFGINVLIINVLIIVFLGIIYPGFRVSAKRWVFSAACLMTGVLVVLVHSRLAMITNFISLIVLAGASVDTRSSFFITLINTFYSLLTASLLWLIDKTAAVVAVSYPKKQAFVIRSRHMTMVMVPFVITAVFFGLYYQANPAFSNLIRQIEIDIFPWSWLKFTLLGYLVLFGAFFLIRSLSCQKQTGMQQMF